MSPNLVLSYSQWYLSSEHLAAYATPRSVMSPAQQVFCRRHLMGNICCDITGRGVSRREQQLCDSSSFSSICDSVRISLDVWLEVIPLPQTHTDFLIKRHIAVPPQLHRACSISLCAQ